MNSNTPKATNGEETHYYPLTPEQEARVEKALAYDELYKEAMEMLRQEHIE